MTTEERNRLTEANLPLAKFVTKRLWDSGKLSYFDTLNDALQEAYLVLMRAVEGFDPSVPKANWGGYLYQCLYRELLHLNAESSLISCPYWTRSIKTKINRPALFKEVGILHVTTPYEETMTLDFHDGYDNSLGLQIEELRRGLKYLTPNERDTIISRFGLDGNQKSMRQYARQRGVSRELVRCWYRSGMEKLRERLEGIVWKKEAA